MLKDRNTKIADIKNNMKKSPCTTNINKMITV